MQEQVLDLPITSLHESNDNSRRNFELGRMDGLQLSIHSKGILVPLIVRDCGTEKGFSKGHSTRYEIVAGARRYLAARNLKMQVLPCIVREMTDGEAIEVQITENDQRADIHPLEQANGYRRLMEVTPGVDVEHLATKMGRSASFVYQRLKLTDLIPPMQKAFLEDRFTTAQAIMIARLTQEQQSEVGKWFKERLRYRQTFTVRELAQDIQYSFHLTLAKAPFDTKAADLVPAAGSCIACPKRTGANALLFGDIKEKDTCTDPVCFQAKLAAFVARRRKEQPEAVPLTVASGNGGGKAKGKTGWRRAAGAKCPKTTLGIIVEIQDTYLADDGSGKLGQLLEVCLDEKCKIHHPQRTIDNGSYQAQYGYSRKQEKKRKLDLRRRALIFRELTAEPFDVGLDRMRDVLDWAISCLSHDTAKALCQAMGWDVKMEHGTGDFSGVVKRQLAKIGPAAVAQWTYQIMLADSELWYYSGSTCKPAHLEALARAQKVPLAELAKKAAMNEGELAKIEGPKGKNPKQGGNDGNASPAARRKTIRTTHGREARGK